MGSLGFVLRLAANIIVISSLWHGAFMLASFERFSMLCARVPEPCPTASADKHGKYPPIADLHNKVYGKKKHKCRGSISPKRDWQ